jgi:hypothetical protein
MISYLRVRELQAEEEWKASLPIAGWDWLVEQHAQGIGEQHL